MNTRIEKDFCFLAGLHFNDKFYVNSYDVTVSMLVETENIYEQNVAINRSIYFINNVLQNSVLVNINDKLVVEKYRQADVKICEFPDEPYDQLIATVLLLKLNAIMEDRLKVTDILLSSYLSDGVKYNVVAEVAEAIYPENAWYNKSCPDIAFVTANNTDENVVKLFENKWLELGLDWREK